MNLTQGQQVRIRILHEIMGSKWSSNLTDTLNNFALDAGTERELQISERAVATYLVVTSTRGLNDAGKDECWSLIIDLFLGCHKIRREKLQLLTEDDAQYIETVFGSDFTQ